MHSAYVASPGLFLRTSNALCTLSQSLVVFPSNSIIASLRTSLVMMLSTHCGADVNKRFAKAFVQLSFLHLGVRVAAFASQIEDDVNHDVGSADGKVSCTDRHQMCLNVKSREQLNLNREPPM